ncbi:MAG: ATP-binding cassette domain-containing protein, partial [Myxococcaceae bacterium]
KIIAGELKPDRGEVTFGHNVIMGYYAQHHADTLQRDSSILDEVHALVPDKPQSYVRGVLGAFLFTGDDVEKKIGVLSGGERARVALAKLLLEPANLMLMDEPTNHLDLDSSEALIEALQGYEGTLLFVSHNRSFLNALATHVWEVKDHAVTEYPGNLDDYLYHLQQQQAEEERTDATAEAHGKPVSEKDRKRAEAEFRQQKSKLEAPIKKEIAAIEARIAALEAEQKVQEAQLAEPSVYDDFAKARALTESHQAGKAELEALYAKWEDAQVRLEQVISQIA